MPATRLATFTPSEVFPFVVTDPNVKTKHPFQVGDKTHNVKVSSERLILFKSNPKCVSCGIEGSFFALEQKTKETPHMNFYAILDGEEILMTKDHIVPISKGGQDHMDNYQTMCCTCNQIKSARTIKFGEPPPVHVLSQEFKDTIEWPGRGVAKRQPPRGMSDYSRLGNNAIYSTGTGFKLYLRREYVIEGKTHQHQLRCKAQSKNFTSPSFSTTEEAMAWVDRQMAFVPNIPSEIEWPGVGVAKLTDQKSDKNYRFFKTDNGALLQANPCSVSENYPEGLRWIAQYQGCTTKWMPSVNAAIEQVEKMVRDMSAVVHEQA
jgi:5-methylcytosine-specific restriction endonuclease McrA